MRFPCGRQAVVLTAIPYEASKTFSKRDREILRHAKTFAADQGLDWDELSADRKLEIVEEARQTGKLGKMKTDERRIWREQAEALGWAHTTVMEGAKGEALTDTERFDRAYEFTAKALAKEFHTAAVLSHEKIGMYAARA